MCKAEDGFEKRGVQDTSRLGYGVETRALKKLGEIETVVHGSFDRSPMQKMLNMHYLGQTSCNERDKKGNLVPIDHPNMAICEKAHWTLCENFVVKIKGDLLEDGRVINLRVPD